MRLIDIPLYILMRLLKALDRRKTGLECLRPEDVLGILVVSSTAIGDTLLSTPAMRALRASYPKARITALLNASNMELFRDMPYADDVVAYHGGYCKFFLTVKELKKRPVDLAVILHGNEPQATPLCYLSGARFIVKLPNKSAWSFLLSNGDKTVGWDDLSHGIDARLKTAVLAGCRPSGIRMELFLDNADLGRAAQFLRDAGVKEEDTLVGFQVGASTLSRQWFPERFIELGRRLVAEDPAIKIVLTGSRLDMPLCDAVEKGLGKNAINAAGRLPIRQAAGLIKRLDCLITGDTGPMHIAITLGTPVVALYAVSDPARTGPLYDIERHRVIKKPRTCDPCVSKKCGYQRCMEAITVDEVAVAIKEVMGARGAKA